MIVNWLRRFLCPTPDPYTPDYVDGLVKHTEDVAASLVTADEEFAAEVITHHPNTDIANVLLRARERQRVAAS